MCEAMILAKNIKNKTKQNSDFAILHHSTIEKTIEKTSRLLLYFEKQIKKKDKKVFPLFKQC